MALAVAEASADSGAREGSAASLCDCVSPLVDSGVEALPVAGIFAVLCSNFWWEVSGI